MIERNFYSAKCNCGNKIQLVKGTLSYGYFKKICELKGWQRKGKKWFCPDCQGEK